VVVAASPNDSTKGCPLFAGKFVISSIRKECVKPEQVPKTTTFDIVFITRKTVKKIKLQVGVQVNERRFASRSGILFCFIVSPIRRHGF
jgi:hypothetical protein